LNVFPLLLRSLAVVAHPARRRDVLKRREAARKLRVCQDFVMTSLYDQFTGSTSLVSALQWSRKSGKENVRDGAGGSGNDIG
jgi:hypothetical protein